MTGSSGKAAPGWARAHDMTWTGQVPRYIRRGLSAGKGGTDLKQVDLRGTEREDKAGWEMPWSREGPQRPGKEEEDTGRVSSGVDITGGDRQGHSRRALVTEREDLYTGSPPGHQEGTSLPQLGQGPAGGPDRELSLL